MAGPWNDSLALAMKHADFAVTASTTPTTTEATAIWAEESAMIEGELLAAGVTISSGGKDETLVQGIEAMLSSAAIQQVAEIQRDGKVSEHTKELRRVAQKRLDRLIANPEVLADLGASYDVKTGGPWPSCQGTANPNNDYDSSDVKEVLPTFKQDMDL